MNNFQYLVLAHLILDYPLQGEFLGVGKSKYNFLLLVHVVMWSLGVAATLQWLGMYGPWKLQWLFWGHLIMDYLKCKGHLVRWCTKGYQALSVWEEQIPQGLDKTPPSWITDNLGLSLWIDQSFHIIQLIICLTGWGTLW